MLVLERTLSGHRTQNTPTYTKAFERRTLRIYELTALILSAQTAETAIKSSNYCFERLKKAEKASTTRRQL
jgi:predicted GIY-YIG superfamily endonuclease